MAAEPEFHPITSSRYNTPSVTDYNPQLLRGENDSKQSDEFQAIEDMILQEPDGHI